jgi:hypothetical protein
VFCADRLWRIYGGDRSYRPWVCAPAIAFFPVMYVIFAGQSGGWLLLGVTGLVLATTRGPMGAALLIPFAALKPHLFVPIWVVLALEAGRTRRGRAVFGWGVACGPAAMLVPAVADPEVWKQYLAALNRPYDAAHPPLSGWRSPLVGYWVRRTVAPEAFWIQAVPTVLVLLATPAYWWVRRRAWDWSAELPRLVLAGLIAAPYGAWPYDQTVLLVPVAAAATQLVRHGTRGQVVAAFAVLGVVNAVALTIREGEHFVWVPPVVAIWYGWVTAAVRPGRKTAGESANPEAASVTESRVPVEAAR